MPKRYNIPGNRTPLTIDSKGDTPEQTAKLQARYFKQLQSEGIIPGRFKSMDDLQDEFVGLVLDGLSDSEAAEELGVDYRNVIGNKVLGLNLSSKGTLRGIQMRSLREDIKPDEAAWFKKNFGEEWYNDYKRYRQLEWGDIKGKKADKEIINRFSPDPENFQSAKEEADFLRDRLGSVFGKNGSASQVHRGHGFSAMDGASVGRANLVPEWGPGNVSHGSAPRYDKRIMADLGMSSNDLQNYFDDLLVKEGLTLTPSRMVGNYVSADEYLRELNQGTRMYSPESSEPFMEGRVMPESLELREIKANDAIQQLTEERIRRGVDPVQARVEAKRRVSEYAMGNSTLFDTTHTVGGPVKVIKPKDKMPTVVSTKGKRPNKLQEAKELARQTRNKPTAWEAGKGQGNWAQRLGKAGRSAGVVGTGLAAVGIADTLLRQGNAKEALIQAVETFTPLGEISEPVQAPIGTGELGFEQERLEQMRQREANRNADFVRKQKQRRAIRNRGRASTNTPSPVDVDTANDWFGGAARNLGF